MLRETIRWLSLATVLFLCLLTALRWSGAVALKDIRVTGVYHLSPQWVKNLTGFSPGANMFRLDYAGAKERIEEEPWVADVHLRRSFFRGIVEVEIAERKPVGRVRLEGGKVFWIDADGLILGPTDALPPVAEGVEAIRGRVPREVAYVLRVYSHYPRCLSAFPYLDFSAADDVILRSGDGELSVHCGPPSRVPGILPLLEEFLAHRPDLKPFGEIDCRWGQELILVPRGRGGG